MKCVVILLVLFGSFAVFAQQEAPPLESKPQVKSRTWTNEDLEKLKGTVNVLGGKDTAIAAASPSAPKTEKGEEKCESDAWVAALTMVLKDQGIPYGPRYWSERLFGDACLSGIAVGTVASRLNGDYTLDDGTKLHVAGTVNAGLPNAPQIVAAMDERRPPIVKWKKQPLILTKIDYIDRQYDYVSVYSIARLMLMNPLSGRVLLFDMKTNSDKEIDGSLQVKVSKRP